MPPLSAWDNFYVILGSSAGALTGLTFIVITLVVQVRRGGNEVGIGAFTTPTVVHFGVVLFASVVVAAPWQTLGPPAVLLGLCGLAGLLYTAIVLRRQRRVQDYEPVIEDWLWYVICPFVAYAVLLVAALLLATHPVPLLFAVAGALVGLLFVGIRNAWDVVTYLALVRLAPRAETGEQAEQRAPRQ